MSRKEYLKKAEQATPEAGEMLKANIDSNCEISFKGGVDVF